MSSNRSDLEILTDNLTDLSNDLYLQLNPQDLTLNEDTLRASYSRLQEACKSFLSDHEHFERAIVNTLTEAQANTEDRAETERQLQNNQMPSFPTSNF
jgi:hypothetical protein